MKKLISGFTKLAAASALVVSLVACGGADERKVKYLEKGKSYLEDQNYEKARIEFKNVLQIDPKFSDAYYYMGELEEKNKELVKAMGNYRKAIEINPKHTQAKIKLARIYVIAGTDKFISMANELLSSVKGEDPENVEAEFVTALIEYKKGSKTNALVRLEKIVEQKPSHYEAAMVLSTIYISKDLNKKAIDVLKVAVQNNLENVVVRLSVANLLTRSNDLVGAEKYLIEALNIKTDDYALHKSLASFYLGSNQYDKAENVLRNAIKLDDDDAKRYIVLVDILAKKVSLKAAEQELESAVQAKPDNYDLKFAQVEFYKNIGQGDKAKKILNQIMDSKAYDIQAIKARTKLAEYLFDEGDYSAAKLNAENVLEENPKNIDALLVESRIALKNFDSITAINSLRNVVKSDPKNAQASLLLAQAHELNKDSALAENVLKKSIEANPVNAMTHENYARYLLSKGRVDEGVNVVDKALVYFKDNFNLMNIKMKVLASQGKESEILTLMERMEQANADNAEVYIIKGQYFVSKKDTVLAVEQFEKALKLSKDKYKSLEFIVKAYMLNNQPGEALNRLQNRLVEIPNDPFSNHLMGQIFITQNKIDDARSKFIQASKSAEKWEVPYLSLASTYLSENNIEQAIAIYQDAISKLNNAVKSQLQLASIYERKQDFDKAMDIYQGIIDKTPNNMIAANNYASLLLDYGDASGVVKALSLTKGFEFSQQLAFQDTLGWAYAKKGESAKAVELLKPVVEKAPKIAVFRYHLGYALYHMGDKVSAKSHLELSISSKQDFPGKDNAEKLLKSI